MKIGLIADTHAQLHPDVPRAFRGVDAILHAGDVGSESVLSQLAALAPVTAIHGNADPPKLQHALPPQRVVDLETHRVVLVHQAQAGRDWLPQLRQLIAAERPQVVVFGHSHVQYLGRHDGVLFVNPGGGGRRRFRLRRSVAVLELNRAAPAAHLVWLDPA
jgi:putative phosphoesterase